MDLTKYLHASLFSPVKSTLIKAIDKGFLMTFPGLTSALIKKHLPTPLATALGHQVRERQGLQSTTSPPKTYANRLATIKAELTKLKKQMKPGETLEQTCIRHIEEDFFPNSTFTQYENKRCSIYHL